MEVMYSRTILPPEGSFFLFGARGTGKSTWLKEHFSQAHWFNFLDEGLYQNLLVDPEAFRNRIRHLKPGSWVVVDEVQRLPNLLNEVHRGIEDGGLRFALTGSSARKLNRAGVNLLAGRAKLRSMLPLLPRELGSDFDLDSVLRWGSIPLVWDQENRDEALKDYVQLYIREEIQAEALVRNLAGFARSVPVAALYHGQVVNVSSLARDVEIERKTVEGYLQILEDTLLIKRLQPYQAKITVREKKKPKLYWVDPGIVRAAKGVYGTLAPEERGSLLEGFVFAMIRNEIENARRYDEVFYWAPSKGQTEVDFLLKSGRDLFAIEVKASKKIRPEHLRGLQSIAALKGVKKRVLVYSGDSKQMTAEGIEILPLRDFEEALVAGFS